MDNFVEDLLENADINIKSIKGDVINILLERVDQRRSVEVKW